MTILMGRWEQLSAGLLEQTDEPDKDATMTLIKVAGVAFMTGVAAVLYRLDEGATRRRNLKCFSKRLSV